MSDALVTGSLQSFASLVDDAALRFERAWDGADPGARPALESFLPTDPGAHDRAALRLAQIDIERRTAAGHEPRAEEYLQRFPALATDPEDVFALVLTEAEGRIRASKPVDPNEYRRRFPDVVDRLIARLLHRTLPRIPNYEIEGELGRGGMGMVYKARQVKLNRTVALKVVTAPDRQSVTRFLLEAEAVAAVRHPHVIQVFDSGEYADLPYLAMEYLEGGTLQQALKRAPVMAPNAAAQLVARLADGVQAVHAAGTVHRDLKPANVLFDTGGAPKVADFGLALRGGVELTQTQGKFLGTPAYAAPEQAAGQREFVGPGADVWSLGVILYECLTGRRPFDGSDALSVLNKVQTQNPPAPRAVNPAVPRDLELICLKCLEKEPRDRYPSAAALADDLRRYADGKPVAVRPVGALTQTAKWVRRNPVPAALFLAVALGLVATSAASLVAMKNARERADAEAARGTAERDAADSATKQLQAERVAAASVQKELEAQREEAVAKEGRARAERTAAVSAALQANDLKRVVDTVKAAERDNLEVTPQQSFDAATALESLGYADEARTRLTSLEARPGVTRELRARVQLRLADLLLGIDDERAAVFLRAARAGNLPPADLAYADALEAREMRIAITNLQRAVGLDPAHIPARRLLGMYLFVSGRLDETIRLAEGSLLVTRNHPDILWPLFMAYGFKGEREKTRAVFDLLRPQLTPETAGPFELLAEFLPVLNAEFQASVAGETGPGADLVKEFERSGGRAKILGAADSRQALTAKLFARMPPVFRDALDDYAEFSFSTAARRDYCGELCGNEVRLSRLRANLQRRPEGFMQFVYAFTLFCRANAYVGKHGNAGPHGRRYRELMAQSGDAYMAAYNTPGLIDARASALEGAALAYALAGKPNWAAHEPAPAWIKKSADAVRLRMELPDPHPMSRINLLVLVSRNAEDWTTARRVLDLWEGLQPNDTGCISLRAEIEFKAGAFLPALAAARRILAKEPTHAAMRQMEADCLAQLRHDPQRLAPPPRAK